MSNTKKRVFKLGDVVDFRKGKPLASHQVIKGKYGVVAGGTKINHFHNEYNAENCITVSSSGTAGHLMYHKNKKVFLTDCFSVSPKNENELTKDFLFFFLQKNQERMYNLASGGGIPHFYPKDMEDFEIEIPESIEEQKRIVEILTNVDDKVLSIEKEIEQLIKTKTGLIEKLFSEGDEYLIEDLSTIDEENVSESSEIKDFHYISISNIKHNNIEYENLEKFKTIKNAPSRARRVVRENNILFSSVRPNLKQYAHINKKVDNILASTGIINIKSSIDSYFLYTAIQSNYFYKQVLSSVVGGNYPAINSSDFRKIKVLINSDLDKEKIGLMFKNIDKLLLNKKTELTNLLFIKKGLLVNLI